MTLRGKNENSSSFYSTFSSGGGGGSSLSHVFTQDTMTHIFKLSVYLSPNLEWNDFRTFLHNWNKHSLQPLREWNLWCLPFAADVRIRSSKCRRIQTDSVVPAACQQSEFGRVLLLAFVSQYELLAAQYTTVIGRYKDRCCTMLSVRLLNNRPSG